MEKELTVLVVGGGIAGSTVGICLANLGIQVEIMEKGCELVNGPPACHLHAGGNLYREISDVECMTLLKQSIELMRFYKEAINVRPTLLTIPIIDKGDTKSLLSRLSTLKAYYETLIQENSANGILKSPEFYYQAFSREEVLFAATKSYPKHPKTLLDFLIPVAKEIDVNAFKFPFVMVNEFGIALFRMAALAEIMAEHNSNLTVHLNTSVEKISVNNNSSTKSPCFQVDYRENGVKQTKQFNYIINAAGYETGKIDDMLAVSMARLAEFKAAYVVNWEDKRGIWPEVIFHGERGTPQGMAQLTPYQQGFFQLHGMTKAITLFDDGLSKSTNESAQPEVSSNVEKKAHDTWCEQELSNRSQASIDYMATFIPKFKTAKIGYKAMCGIQQVPGEGLSLRTADVTFPKKGYARVEIVKFSSVIASIKKIIKNLTELEMYSGEDFDLDQVLKERVAISKEAVETRAKRIAKRRKYPEALSEDYSYE